MPGHVALERSDNESRGALSVHTHTGMAVRQNIWDVAGGTRQTVLQHVLTTDMVTERRSSINKH